MTETQSRLLTRVAQPSAEPLSLSEAKLYLRVDGSSEDNMITDMISAVREAAEEYLQRSLVTQSWKLALDDYAPAVLPLPRGPVQSVTSVTIIDRLGNSTAVDTDVYYLNAGKTALCFDSTPLGHRVEVVYVTGFGDADDVPYAIRQGMLNHLAVLYDNRVEGMHIPASSLALYRPFRELRISL